MSILNFMFGNYRSVYVENNFIYLKVHDFSSLLVFPVEHRFKQVQFQNEYFKYCYQNVTFGLRYKLLVLKTRA